MTEQQRNAIAVGLDGSPASMAALHWAAMEAERCSAPLRLVHARGPMPTSGHARESVEEQRGPAPQELVDGAREEVLGKRPDLRVEGEVLAGGPEAALLGVVAESQMLVLGSYGFHRLPGFSFGSTALATVARAERPVVLVRADGDPDATGGAMAVRDAAAHAATEEQPSTEEDREVSPRAPRIVVALAVDHSGENLLRFAFETAQATGLPLYAVHAIKMPSHVYIPGGPVVPHMAVANRKRVENSVRQMVRLWAERYPDIELHAALRLAGTAQAVAHEAEGADLLVLGCCRKHRIALRPSIGPVAHAAVHHAACPVAVVPHD